MTDSTFLKALMLGAGRNRLDAPASLRYVQEQRPDAWLLPATALFGQQLRHRRFALPQFVEGGGLPDDPRPIVPDAARPLMVRLLGKGDTFDFAARAVRLALRQANLRVHPFDLPHLTALLALGPNAPQERAWLARTQPDQAEGGDDGDGPTPEDWQHHAIGTRVEFLRDLRRRDPAAARELVLAALPNEPAGARAKLIGALRVNLSSDDIELLEAQLGGRAKSVHDAAEALLALLPGTEAHARRAEDVARCLVPRKTRRGEQGVRLMWRRPSDLRVAPQIACVAELHGVDLDALAAHLSLDVDGLFEAAGDDVALSAGLLAAALSTGRPDAVRHALTTPDVDVRLLLPAADERPDAAAVAAALAGRMLERDRGDDALMPYHLHELHRRLEGPLPAQVADDFVRGPTFARTIAAVQAQPLEAGERHLLEPLAALLPPSTRPTFRAAIAPLALGDRQRPELLLDLLALLDPAPR